MDHRIGSGLLLRFWEYTKANVLEFVKEFHERTIEAEWAYFLLSQSKMGLSAQLIVYTEFWLRYW